MLADVVAFVVIAAAAVLADGGDRREHADAQASGRIKGKVT